MRRRPESERIYELVGRKVERQRREAGLTQTQLAQRCGLARGSIANIERGNQRPTLHTLWSIADALNIDPPTLVPSREEFLRSKASAAQLTITGRLEKAAGESREQVVSYITSRRKVVGSNVDNRE